MSDQPGELHHAPDVDDPLFEAGYQFVERNVHTADIDAVAPAMQKQERDAEWARSMRQPPLDVEEFYRD